LVGILNLKKGVNFKESIMWVRILYKGFSTWLEIRGENFEISVKRSEKSEIGYLFIIGQVWFYKPWYFKPFLNGISVRGRPYNT
jgi:hypothetical protein